MTKSREVPLNQKKDEKRNFQKNANAGDLNLSNNVRNSSQ